VLQSPLSYAFRLKRDISMEKRSEIKVIEQAQSAATMHAHHCQQQSLFSGVGCFIVHFWEMCAIMRVSLAIFESIPVWAGSL
jgi:hypothetical protein